MKIYVASSWRNHMQSMVVKALRAAGFEVYDFKNPAPGNHGFHWSELDPNWKDWTPEQFREHLDDEIAVDGFDTDYQGMNQCDACVLVLPCGRSAHLEAGWFIGQGKPTVILLSDGEPELMYHLADRVCVKMDEVVAFLEGRD